LTRVGIAVALAAALAMSLVGTPAVAAEGARAPDAVRWPFEGVFGKYDRGSLRRGLEVYLNSCSFCHSLRYVAYRNLTEIGLTEHEAKEIAARSSVPDGPNEFGEMFTRQAILSDRFVPPFPNEQAARFANGGALPPDLSLMVKARKRGASYLFSLMTGYEDFPPEDVELAPGMMYNPYFAGGQIAMPPPLFEGLIANAEGAPATVEEMAHDVTQFLAWAAEPKLEARKSMGLRVMIFLVILTGLFIAVKRRVWSSVH